MSGLLGGIDASDCGETPLYRSESQWWMPIAEVNEMTHLLELMTSVHLRRYQSYAIPASPVITRGSFAVHWIPPPTPHSTRPAFPAAEHMVPSQGFSTAQRRISMNPPASGRAPSPPKLSKAEHKARRLRLLQFRYALDQEHERRFRRAMRAVIPNIVDFETKSM